MLFSGICFPFSPDFLYFYRYFNEQKAEQEGVEAVTELAFIMAKQAEKADMNKLNEDIFIEWLEGFGSMAFVENAEQIIGVYMESATSTATP